jgi:hypothetical protein
MIVIVVQHDQLYDLELTKYGLWSRASVNWFLIGLQLEVQMSFLDNCVGNMRGPTFEQFVFANMPESFLMVKSSC